MKNWRYFVLGLILAWCFLGLIALLSPVSAQITNEPTDLYLRLAQDDAGYYMTCIQGCTYYNSLGTVEELNRRFPEYHCAINWAHSLRNRRREAWAQLGYLSGPNGDLSNPLCGS